MTPRTRNYLAAFLLIVTCLISTGPLAAHNLDCAHSHPGGGRTVCDDSLGDPCTTQDGEDGTCKQFTKNCLCVASAADDPHAPQLADAPAATPPSDQEENTGRPALVQVTFVIDGLGSFQAGNRDTAAGHNGGLFGNAAPLLLRAKPAPGMRFNAWFLNGNFASTSNPHKVFARAGLEIEAQFVPAGRPAATAAAASPLPLEMMDGARTCSYTCFNHTCSIECREGEEAKCSCRQVKKEPNGWQWLPFCRCR